MKRWIVYLLLSLVMQFIAWIITPILPLFAVKREGPLDNANSTGMGTRLPVWLSWFDTPDNPLEGDGNWHRAHPNTTYADMVGWLYRNSLYGFKWSILSAPMIKDARVINGMSPTWKAPGTQYITMGDYWQWHTVRVIGPWVVNLNFGWLLNDGDQPKALFMFSPRWRRAHK